MVPIWSLPSWVCFSLAWVPTVMKFSKSDFSLDLSLEVWRRAEYNFALCRQNFLVFAHKP